jgi:cytochrome c-type biogenesis protein CcmE
MKARQKRMIFIALGIVGVGVAAWLAIGALQSNIAYFFSPSQVLANEAPANTLYRLGGLVVKNSLVRQADGLTVHFDVTDMAQTVKVSYTGILPDLFGEGQGVVTKGRMGPGGVFVAEEVLAKHDESYMPPEVKDSLQTAHVEGVVKMASQDSKSPGQPGAGTAQPGQITAGGRP